MFDSLIKILKNEIDRINTAIFNSTMENDHLSKFLEDRFEIFKDENGIYDVSNIKSFFGKYLPSKDIENLRMSFVILNNSNGAYDNEFSKRAFDILNDTYEKINHILANTQKINSERKSDSLKYQALLDKFSSVTGNLVELFTSSEIDILLELFQRIEFYDYKVISELNKQSLALYEEKIAIIKCIERNRKRVLKPKKEIKQETNIIDSNIYEQISKAKKLLDDYFSLPEKDFIDLFESIKPFIIDLNSLKQMADDWLNEEEKANYFMLFIKSLIEDETRRSTLDMEMLNFSVEEAQRCIEYINRKDKIKSEIILIIKSKPQSIDLNNLSDYERKKLEWASQSLFDANLNLIEENIDIVKDLLKIENSTSLCILFKMFELRDKLENDNLSLDAFKEITFKIQKLNDMYDLYYTEDITNEIIEGINEVCSLEYSPSNIQIIFMPMEDGKDETSVEDFAYTYESKNKNGFNSSWLKNFIVVLKELRSFSLADLTNDAICKHDVTNENTGYRCRRKGNTRCIFEIIRKNDITILLVMAFGHKYDVSHEWEYLQTKKMINIHDNFIKKLEEEIESLGTSKTVDLYHQKGYDSLIRLGLKTGALKENDISKLNGVK